MQILLFLRTLSANELAFSDDALSRLETNTYNDEERDSIVEELDNDVIFQDIFLKYYKTIAKLDDTSHQDTSVWRLKNDEQLRKIETIGI